MPFLMNTLKNNKKQSKKTIWAWMGAGTRCSVAPGSTQEFQRPQVSGNGNGLKQDSKVGLSLTRPGQLPPLSMPSKFFSWGREGQRDPNRSPVSSQVWQERHHLAEAVCTVNQECISRTALTVRWAAITDLVPLGLRSGQPEPLETHRVHPEKENASGIHK